MWLHHNWFKLTFLLIFVVGIFLTAYYFFIFQPKLILQGIQLQNDDIFSSTTTDTSLAFSTNSTSTPPTNILSAAQALNAAQTTPASATLTQSLLQKVMERIVLVKCYGSVGAVQGSGTAGLITGPYPIVVTNFHVPSEAGGVNSTCSINIPSLPNYTPGDLFVAQVGLFDPHYSTVDIGDDVDAAILDIENVSQVDLPLFSKFPISFCDESKVQIGDNITILGYPQFGENISTGAQSLTVTTGIVSGFIQTNYGVNYKTDASFGHGVSGGLVILNKNACVLGIPTWANTDFESGATLGEIESWDSIKNSGGIFQTMPSTPAPSTSASAPTQSQPTQTQSTPQSDEIAAEQYYQQNHTCVGLSGNQYNDCINYAYNH